MALALSACAPAAPEPSGRPTITSEELRARTGQRGTIITDGHENIRIASAGEVACGRTSAADIARGIANVNRSRASAGLAPVSHDPKVQRAAEMQACHMARTGTMTHDAAKGGGLRDRLASVGYRSSIASENIAGGQFSLDQALANWNASGAHRSNLMLPNVRHAGIAGARSADGGTAFWAAIYAGPSSR